ncbi:hypothetical protein CEXT_421761 [Caerostris extrusa]|uniref:Uncharacterized protein n=1 Tax=Caerostris extrusa TaxID=172846 RepID=A0AAV4U827_CAEEX|nr:hypothetical protein CEXT_421761 [Caerostris extrusa]
MDFFLYHPLANRIKEDSPDGDTPHSCSLPTLEEIPLVYIGFGYFPPEPVYRISIGCLRAVKDFVFPLNPVVKVREVEGSLTFPAPCLQKIK